LRNAMPINEVWHLAHPMPPKATVDQRIQWHVEHARACGWRPIPSKLLEEMQRRGLAPLR